MSVMVVGQACIAWSGKASLLRELKEVTVSSELWKSGEERSIRGSCKCKGPEVGMGLACMKSSVASVGGGQKTRWTGADDRSMTGY